MIELQSSFKLKFIPSEGFIGINKYVENVVQVATLNKLDKLANMVVENAYHEFEDPDISAYNIEVGMNTAEKQRRKKMIDLLVTNHFNETEEYERNKAILFQIMYNFLDQNSIDALESRTHNINGHEFSLLQIKKEKEPLALWMSIRQMHLTLNGISSVRIKENAKRCYYNLQMNESENLMRFYERYMESLEMLENAEVDIPDAKTLADNFLSRINSKYNVQKQQLAQLEILSPAAVPNTLEKMLHYLSVNVEEVKAPRQSTATVFKADAKEDTDGKEESSVEKKKKKKKQFKCKLCGSADYHYFLNCPVQMEMMKVQGIKVENDLIKKTSKYGQICFDTAANENLFNKHSTLISDISPSRIVKKFSSFNPDSPILISKEVAKFKGLEVYVSDNAPTNILSCSKVLEHTQSFGYNELEKAFTIVLKSGDRLKFVLENGIYVFNEEKVNNIHNVIAEEQEKVFTKEQVNRAKLAYELVKKMGVSYKKIRELLTGGHLINTNFDVSDLDHAQQIYGNPLEAVLGKFKNKNRKEFRDQKKEK